VPALLEYQAAAQPDPKATGPERPFCPQTPDRESSRGGVGNPALLVAAPSSRSGAAEEPWWPGSMPMPD